MRPHIADQERPARSTRAPTRTTPSTGWSRTCRDNNGQVGMYGHLVPRLLRRRRHDRRPPGAEGRLAAGARSPTGSWATTSTTTARCSCRTPSTSCRRSASRARADARSRAPRLRPRHARRLQVLPRHGAAAERRREVLQGRDRVLERDDGARARTTSSGRRATCGRTCKNIKPAVLTVGGWFDAENLTARSRRLPRRPRRRAPAPTNMLVMGPWVHGGWARGDGDRSATCTFGAKTRAFYREKIELPFFELPPEGQGRPTEPARGVRCSRPARTCGAQHDAWPPKDATPTALHFHAGGAAARRDGARRTTTGASTSSSATRRSRCRTSRTSRIGMMHEYMVDDQRFAVDAARRARLPDRRARGRPDARRADRGGAATCRRPAPTPTGS